MKRLTNVERSVLGIILVLMSTLGILTAVYDWARYALVIVVGLLYVGSSLFVIARRVQAESRATGQFVISGSTRMLLLAFSIGYVPLIVAFVQLFR